MGEVDDMRMRFVPILLVALLAGGSASAGSTSRRATDRYRGPSAVKIGDVFVHGGPVHVADQPAAGGIKFATRPGESRVSLSVRDDSGTDFVAYVEAVLEYGPSFDTRSIGSFCGRTDKPLRVPPSVEIFVYVTSEACDGSQSLPTEGVVTARFTKA